MKFLLKILPWCFVALFGTEIAVVMLPKKDGVFQAREFGRLPVLLVWGEDDDYYDPAKVAHDAQRLADAGVACRVVTFAGGHQVKRELLLRLASEELRAP